MKNSLVLVLGLCLSGQLFATSPFIPENGHYIYRIDDIASSMDESGMSYVTLNDVKISNGLFKQHKLNKEYQIKDWYLRDWFQLQDLFKLDEVDYVRSQGATSFNEAKKKQFAKFAFDKKRYYHLKTIPTMKEWGGLTHPPLKKLTRPLSFYDKRFAPVDYTKVSSPFFSSSLQREIDKASKSELTFGNKLTVLADQRAYQTKLKLIQNARETILMSSLVFMNDKSTNYLIDQLITKHRQGVQVKILVDGMIGKVVGATAGIKRMQKAGIEVLETSDFFKHRLKAIYHTKTLVVDFKTAVAGGHNMIDADNLSRSTDFMNRDIDLKITGPMVTDIARQFVENWAYQSKYKNRFEPLSDIESIVAQNLSREKKLGLRGEERYQQILSNPASRMNGVCRFVKQAPYEDRHTIGKAYLKLLDKVKHHLVIEDPVKVDTAVTKFWKAPIADKFDSFTMFNQLHQKVQSLARGGLNLDYLTTNIHMAGNENVAVLNGMIKEQLEANKKMAANLSLLKIVFYNKYFGNPQYKNLLNEWIIHPKVNVWTNISFLHSKVFYFDRIVASVGSYNFQHNATDQAYESTAICMDEALNRQLDSILVMDMANSIPLIFSRLQ